MPEATAQKSPPSRLVNWSLVGLVVLVLGAGIGTVTLRLRSVIRERIVAQDAQMLYAASLILRNLGEDGGDLSENPELELAQLTQTTELEEYDIQIIAMRLYNAEGQGIARFPPEVRNSEVPAEALATLRTLEPVSRFDSAMALGEVLSPSASEWPLEEEFPLITALVPLRQDGEFAGAAEFVMSGEKVAAALRALDRDLLLYGALIFVVGGGIVSLSLGWAFRRLQRANRLLLRRTESLSRANHQLALAAKTSAIGAVTAHLIHDLKSPLFGLEHFVSTRGAQDEREKEDWELALSTTRRMQKVIADVMRMLQEEKKGVDYEITIEELAALLQGKLEEDLRRKRIEFRAEPRASGSLSNKDANLILLIAHNLASNAIQATPAGGRVMFRALREEQDLVFEVQDTGPGIPERLRAQLFAPCRSGKEGGTGLGLAISKQLANHMGADLQLKESSSAGTIFQLRVRQEALDSIAEPEEQFVLQS